jgi:hypothetical protein
MICYLPSEGNGVTLRNEVERMKQPVEQAFGFNLLELSDRMDDSMEVLCANRTQSLY